MDIYGVYGVITFKKILVTQCYVLRSIFFSGNVLDSCDGRVISNNNIYVDFGVIKNQCSCYFINALNAQFLYTLSRNPGYGGCGTAIQINENNGDIFSIPCSTAPPTVFSSQSTLVKLTGTDARLSGNTGYCLRVLSNGRYTLETLI